MNIAYINTFSDVGGAAKGVRQLHLQMNALPDVDVQSFFITTDDNPRALPNQIQLPVTRRTVAGILPVMRERYLGHQYLYYPDSHHIPERLPVKPDIIHLHNLHGRYFDLAAIPKLAKIAPLVITLHDEWLLTGHCSYTRGCERWRIGCGECPDLAVYPAVRADGTAFNLKRKHRIFDPQLPITVVAPSQWLLDRAKSTYLGHYAMQLIPYGIDLTLYRDGDSRQARRRLGLPEDRQIILFSAGKLTDPFKDFGTLKNSFPLLMTQFLEADRPYLVALGGKLDEEIPNLITPGFIADPETMVTYYQAADLVIHSARTDNLPFAAIEAQACGVPVIGSRVGGVPEIIIDGETGVLVEPQNPQAMADAIQNLLADEPRRVQMGQAARLRAETKFDIQREVAEMLALYRETLQKS